MKKTKMNIREAIKYLEDEFGLEISENTDKWHAEDECKDINCNFKDDADLIKYAEELKMDWESDEEVQRDLKGAKK
jgi:ATP-dependent protease HslVU (ClpYQ) ATPase subunit